jgi:N-ethylmaleimide reductase
MHKEKLFSQLTVGQLTFKNRIFMAPMTRSRALGYIPDDLMAEYYSQRASAGLIITEGSQVSEQGIGYTDTPGIHNDQQVQGWKKVTDAVHEKGGLIFCQLWHVGRASHPDFLNGNLPVAPSAIPFKVEIHTPSGPKTSVTPRELTLEEIQKIIGDHKNAALMAKKAGFDGVEIHGANGYLPAQFLEDGSNHRNDIYGGNVENRSRFLLAITEVAIDVWGKERVSVHLSPRNPFMGMKDSEPEKTYLSLVKALEERKLGILHLVEAVQLPEGVKPLAPAIRKAFSGTLILNTGYTQSTAEEALESGRADAISFGILFLANPDLPERFKLKAKLNPPDKKTFYGGGAQGFTDYPKLAQPTAKSHKKIASTKK